MVRVAARSSADPAAAWALLARPERWARWAPHVRGAWGLAGPDGEVREGARGAARLLGAVPVPARITSVHRGHVWTWQVAGIAMDHEVVALGDGCEVAIVFRAPAPVLALLRVSYAPVCELLMRRVARIAEQEPRVS